MRLSDDWQCLNHQPDGIIGVLNRQFLLSSSLREEGGQIDCLHTGLMLGERYCLGDILSIGEYGQIVLFPIAKAVKSISRCQGRHLTGKQRWLQYGSRNPETDCNSLSGLHHEGFRERQHL